jgi:hypothetical protein
VFSAFFIVNLVVAVICESLISISREPQAGGADAGGDAHKDESQHNDNKYEPEDHMVLQDVMRQLLQNQMEMVASIRVLQQDVKELKDMSEASNAVVAATMSSDEETSTKDERD